MQHHLLRSAYFLFSLAMLGQTAVSAAPPRGLLTAADITSARTLSQNWSDATASAFYNLPQGSQLVPYSWFLHLEQPDSELLFRDAAHIRQLGYLARTPDLVGNPDGLPIGFVNDGGHLGITCAACHTSQINFGGKAWLVDGAPTLADFEQFQKRLVTALDQTLNNDAKFGRFADGVLGIGANAAARSSLKQLLQDKLKFRQGYNGRNLPRAGAAPFGPGRVDAFGAIMNEVATTFAQSPGNDSPANAPVSYPFLWDTPQHDFVQWNGAAQNTDILALKFIIGTRHVGALGRNAGEVLGVFGTLDATREGSLLQLHGYPSSTRKSNLIGIEEMLRSLWSPEWPAELPPINVALRDAGKVLFRNKCSNCHDDQRFRRDDENRIVIAAMTDANTDPTMAANFATRKGKTGVLQGRTAELTKLRELGPEEPIKDLLVHVVQRGIVFPEPAVAPFGAAPFATLASPADLLATIDLNFRYTIHADVKIGGRTISGTFDRLNVDQGKVKTLFSREAMRLTHQAKVFRQDLSAAGAQFHAPGEPTIQADSISGVTSSSSQAGTTLDFSNAAEIRYKYKGRPLNGIWATAPYLHNGSVPNLDELLKPAAMRVARFKVGSRQFDPVKVGFMNDGAFEFDTSLPGNSNAGHEYGTFSDDERKQLIEYMKSL